MIKFNLEILTAIAFDWSSIVKLIEVINTDSIKQKIKGEDMNWSFIPNFPACQTIDLNDYFDFNKNIPIYIKIYFNKIPNLGVELKVCDRKKCLTQRTLESNMFDYNGIPLKIEQLTSGMSYRFAFAFFQTIHLKSDAGQNCEDYPTETFSSYRDCDMDFVYNEMRSQYKFMPFWAAKTLDEVTNLT